MAKVTVLKSPSPLLPNVGMSQSVLMIASLIGGFVVYLAIKQKLGAYWSILIGGGAAATGSATTPAASATTPSTSTTTTPNVATLPSSYGSFLGGLGGTTGTPSGTQIGGASGGTGTPVGTGILGLPNTSQSTFFGLN